MNKSRVRALTALSALALATGLAIPAVTATASTSQAGCMLKWCVQSATVDSKLR